MIDKSGSRVLISVRPGRIRTAILENGYLTDLMIDDDGQESLVGNIYMGRVEKVVPHLAAAFVDLGEGSSGFLAASEARPAGAEATAAISSYLTEGQSIMVQVQRDGFEDKGPKLTARVVVNGRALVLTPGEPGIRLSRRISEPDERQRLKSVAQELAGNDHGLIVRTAAIGLDKKTIEQSANALLQEWDDIVKKAADVKPPARVSRQISALEHVLRDRVPNNVTGIIIDDTVALNAARAWCKNSAPDWLARLHLHTGPDTLFDDYDAATSGGGEDSVEDAIDQALAPSLPLPSGGSVIFSETPALIAFDVNAGGAVSGGKGLSVLATNLQAVDLIARQIRLRNLSGLLVVDFISSKNKSHQGRVLDTLKTAVAGDPSPVFVGGYTRFGLLEMTRQRNRPPLTSVLLAPGNDPDRGLSAFSLAHRALDRLAREADATPGTQVALSASPAIVSALQGAAKPALDTLNDRFGRPFEIVVDKDRIDDGYDLTRPAGNPTHDR